MLTIRSLLLSLCCAASLMAEPPRLSVVQPFGEMVDREVTIQIENLAPLQEIELRAESKDQKGEIWSSHASFRADAQGRVDVATGEPLANSSYTKSDAMGLFWSMSPPSGDDSSSFKCKDDTFLVELNLYIGGNLAGHETMTRYLKAPDVQRIDVKENGLVGALFLPKTAHPLPVVIALSGSNGGLSETRAKLLASNGFAVLALGYFGLDGLPPNLQEIPFEYFEKAFAWLRKQPNLDASHIGLYGVSRGAELSLLLGSFFPDSVQAIAAIVPSSVIYGGLSPTPTNAWTYQSKPILPFAPAPATDFTDGLGQSAAKPANTCQSFLEGMKKTEAFAKAAIPVEKIRCPLLLVSAGDDQMWPSATYAEQIEKRLAETHSPIAYRRVHYPNAGHGIGVPNLPVPGPTYYLPPVKLWLSMGGTRAADAEASADSWGKLVTFFHESLKQNAEMNNREKFTALKAFNLPNDQYAITGSGPLGIRNLREIGDIDILVTSELWTTLSAKYGITDANGTQKITFPGGLIEAFREGSFSSAESGAPTIASRIASAEIIDGLPFDSLENVLRYKRKLAREKDLKDILLLEEWLRRQK